MHRGQCKISSLVKLGVVLAIIEYQVVVVIVVVVVVVVFIIVIPRIATTITRTPIVVWHREGRREGLSRTYGSNPSTAAPPIGGSSAERTNAAAGRGMRGNASHTGRMRHPAVANGPSPNVRRPQWGERRSLGTGRGLRTVT